MKINKVIVCSIAALLLGLGVAATNDPVKLGVVDVEQVLANVDSGKAAREERHAGERGSSDPEQAERDQGQQDVERGHREAVGAAAVAHVEGEVQLHEVGVDDVGGGEGGAGLVGGDSDFYCGPEYSGGDQSTRFDIGGGA